MTTPRRPSALALASALFLAGLARAQEGLELGKMWTFENPPLAYLEQEYGFKPTQEWLDQVRLASIRFGNGCSSSFVSPKGLIMTNHHCARESIDQVSPEGQDWGKEGYYATSYDSEVRVPGLTVQQLIKMREVTADMNVGVGDGDDDATVDSKREANRQKILDAARKESPELKPEIVTLYNGALFQLYQYKVWNDIRLVCAPHLKAAYFGGDPDNFTYPRFCFDFTFLRAWDGDKPADTSAHYFRFSQGGPKDGELVFTVGNPGSTGRLLTLAQLERMRDVYYPIVLEIVDGLIRIMQDYSKTSTKAEQEVRTQMFSMANTQKAFTGYLAGLNDAGRMERKRKAESAFRAKIDGLPMAKQRFGGAWPALEEVAKAQEELEPKRRLQVLGFGAGFGFSKELELAELVVRADHPDVSPEGRKNSRRLAEAFSHEVTPFEAASMRALFVDHMNRAKRWLPKDDSYLQVMLAGKSPEQRYEEIGKSQLRDPAFVKQLLEGGHEAVSKCNDAAIQIALAVVPMMQRNLRDWNSVAVKERVNGERVGQALFAAYGTKVSPDATFTLRFSDGVVRGYPYNGTLAPWKTSMFGLYARACEFDNKDPFDLPRPFLDRRDQIDMSTPLNFVSTNDIIGGNSGSPVINTKREVVGLIFDGNIEQLPNRFLFDDEVARSVSVHTSAIIEALRKVYDAGPLADELLGAK
ncbi:MAG: S46 family peptidase [Planctomycetota bacterium]